jgi:hypothetical protein
MLAAPGWAYPLGVGLRPNFSKPDPSQTKKTGLDFLGFLRPIRGFSMGYEQPNQKM